MTELEQTCIRFGRLVARESGVRYVDLFTGADGLHARHAVFRRVMKARPEIEERELRAAISAALVPGNWREGVV